MTVPPITKGVIAAAGSATRMWPGSKVVPKELFPLGRVPAIVYVIWEMMAAGVCDIILVTRDDNYDALNRLLDDSAEVPSNVRDEPIVGRFQAMLNTCKFTTIVQNGPYGNGTPLLNAYEHVDADACLYAFADDLIFGENVAQGLIATYQRSGRPVMAAQLIPPAETVRFGIVETVERDGVDYISQLIEKPYPGQTSSRLATMGRYVVTRELVDILSKTAIGRGNELWLTDAIVRMIKDGGAVSSYNVREGQWFTIGHPRGYRAAFLAAMRLEEAGSWNDPDHRLLPLRPGAPS